MRPARGEVWLFDLGMTAKTRSVLVVGAPFGDVDRAIVTVIPHTTELRGSTLEVSIPVPSLKAGAFLMQGVASYPTAWAIRKLGGLSRNQMELVMTTLAQWLGLMRN